MTFQELLDQSMQEQREILDLAKKESRAPSHEENQRFEALQIEIENLQRSVDRENAMNDMSHAFSASPLLASPNDDINDIGSKGYREAFLNYMRGTASDEQSELIMNVARKKSNASTGGAVLVPTTLANEIIQLITEQHPILQDVRTVHVPGNFTINLHTGITSGDAEVLPDGECLEPEENTFTSLTLSAYVYAKNIEIPFSMQVMTIDAYEAYLRDELVMRIGSVIASDVISSTGTRTVNSQTAKTITGIIPGIESGNVKEYSDNISYEDLVACMANIANVKGSTVLYVNEKTYWQQLAMIIDALGHPIFMANVATGDINSMLGVPVKLESAIPDGNILLGKPQTGYLLNWAQTVQVESDRNIKCLVQDVTGWCMVDGAPISGKAWTLLKAAVTP